MLSVQTDTLLKEALNKAIILRSEGQYEWALKDMESAREMFESAPLVYQRRFFNGFGVTYFKLGLYGQAIDYYMEALSVPLGDDPDEPFEMAVIRGNIADALVANNEPLEAHSHLDRAEPILRERADKSWLADRLETRARAYLKEGKPCEARDAAQEAYDLHRFGFDSEATAQSLKTLMICFEACGK
jgi:tetratricopeptide (TPR) repeat protein